MPRNASGVCSIPNVFTPNTVISSSQVNANFTDAASMLTDSLSRSGKGGMQSILDMSTFRIVNLGNPSSAQDAVTQAYGIATYARLAAANTFTATNNFTGLLQYGGIEVGYRGMRQVRLINTSDSTISDDRGGLVNYFGVGGHTFTINANLGVPNSLLTIVNSGSGNLTITETLASNLYWFNGSGSFPAGPRTLAVGGWCTVYMSDAITAYITGTGLS